MADGCQHWGPTLDTNGLRRTYPGAFGSDLVQRFALDFIDRNKRQPFFLFYSAILPHDPWVSTPAQPRANTREEKFAAMIEYLDSQVGEILDRLDHHGIASRTLVIFVADNGTHPALRSRRNGVAVQGGKGSTLDAGTHVPLIVRWPERIPAPSVRSQMVDLTDIFATVAMAAGERQAAEGSDGLDLLASSAAAMPSPRTLIYMDYGLGWWPLNPIRYAFDSRWKLYADGKFFETAVDPLEKSLVSPDSNSSEAAAARAALAARIRAMGEHAMTAQDSYFPRGFDPEAVDFGSITRRLAERNVQCGDPARVGS
jgi:arylsulfatase A-like enzyme